MMEELRLTTIHSLSSTMTSLYLRLPLIHWTSLSHSTTPPPTPSSSLPATVLVPVITPPSQPWRVSRTSQKIEVLRHSFPLQLAVDSSAEIYNSTKEGAVIHFQCSDGYQTNQSTTSQCVNSTWYPETLEIVCSRISQNTPESKHLEL